MHYNLRYKQKDAGLHITECEYFFEVWVLKVKNGESNMAEIFKNFPDFHENQELEVFWNPNHEFASEFAEFKMADSILDQNIDN